ncbi:MAG: histidine kinase N-terminal 7TM domain-containing protein [Thermoleophilia bacterium]
MFEPAPWSIALLVVPAVLVPVGFAVAPRRGQRTVRLALAALVLAGLWSVLHGLELGLTGHDARELLGDLKYVGIALFLVAYLLLALDWTGRGARITRRLVLGLAAPGAAVVVLLALPGTHDLVRELPEARPDGSFPAVEAGPVFWAWFAYAYALLLAGTGMLVARGVRLAAVHRRQALVLLVAVVLPLAANIAFNLGLDPFADAELTPMAAMVTAVVVLGGVLRFRLADIAPVARTAVVDQLADPVVVVDPWHRVVDVNRSAEAVVGERADVVGRQLRDVLPAAAGEVAGAEGERAFSLEISTDGRTAILDVRASTLVDRWGRLAGTVLVLRDVTAQRAAERERLRLEAELREAQRLESVGRLAGGLAHDLNNLLTTIIGFTGLAAADLGPAHVASDDLAEVDRAAKRAAELVKNLLAYARQQPLVRRRIDMDDLLDTLVPMLRLLAGEDVEVVRERGPGPHVVAGDGAELERAIVNLALNAKDAMPAGGRLVLRLGRLRLAEPEAAALDVPPGPYVRLEVEDTGIGMSDQVRAQIFEPFFTTKGMAERSGLGLSSVDGVVRQSGGVITVRSAPGSGSAFVVLLPEAGPATEAAAGAPAPEPAAVRTGTILLVEDQDGVRAVLATMLEAVGYDVLRAASGLEALRLAAEHDGPLAALVSDVVMTGMRGPELARRLLAERPGLPVLLVTGHDDDRRASDGLPLLVKPFTGAELVAALDGVLDATPQRT